MKTKPSAVRTGTVAIQPTVSCPVCTASGMEVFFDMKDVPVYCNVFWRTREAALSCPKGEMKLAFCSTCGFIYNLAFDAARLDYNPNYENSLHFSPRFQEYAEDLAARLVERYHLHDKTVIEIGCGKGEFLSLLCAQGRNCGIGFDPSFAAGRADATAGAGITVIRDTYSDRYADYPCNLLCCRHTLEHVADPIAFLKRVRRALRSNPQAAIYFEVPNVLFTLCNNGIWDLIYEHCSYFWAQSLARLFATSGFCVREIREAFGGQFLCLEAVAGESASDGSPDRQEAIAQLASNVATFREHHASVVEKWQKVLNQMRESGQRAVVWGAGSKGVTFLNTLRNHGRIEHVVDINPHKHGKYVPGTGQEVVPPEFLRDYRPEAIVVMNPIYREEIRQISADLGIQTQLLCV